MEEGWKKGGRREEEGGGEGMDVYSMRWFLDGVSRVVVLFF